MEKAEELLWEQLQSAQFRAMFATLELDNASRTWEKANEEMVFYRKQLHDYKGTIVEHWAFSPKIGEILMSEEDCIVYKAFLDVGKFCHIEMAVERLQKSHPLVSNKKIYNTIKTAESKGIIERYRFESGSELWGISEWIQSGYPREECWPDNEPM